MERPLPPISPSDLFLSPDLAEKDAARYLQQLGFRNPKDASLNLHLLVEDSAVREVIGTLAGSLLTALTAAPDPDAALVGVSRYLTAREEKVSFLRYLRLNPPALHALAQILGTSPFLTEILVRSPGYFDWLMSEVEHPGRLF